MNVRRSLFWTGFDDGFKTALNRMKAGETIADLERGGDVDTSSPGSFDIEYQREVLAKARELIGDEIAKLNTQPFDTISKSGAIKILEGLRAKLA